MKTNWQSYLELTEGLLEGNGLSIEEVLVNRNSTTDRDVYLFCHGALAVLFIYRERLLRDLGEW